jgi:hypothetical protein
MKTGHVLQGQEEAQQHCFAVPENMTQVGPREVCGWVLNAAQLHAEQVAQMNTGVGMQVRICKVTQYNHWLPLYCCYGLRTACCADTVCISSTPAGQMITVTMAALQGGVGQPGTPGNPLICLFSTSAITAGSNS